MALAASAVRSGEETRQMQVVCVDDLVPADDDLRRIRGAVDWAAARMHGKARRERRLGDAFKASKRGAAATWWSPSPPGAGRDSYVISTHLTRSCNRCAVGFRSR